MSQDTPNQPDLFMETVVGKMPVADSISSARNWIPVTDIYVGVPEHDSEGKVKLDDKNKPILTKADPHLFVPRPDKNYSTLWWLSVIPFTGLLGIDHLYLRSPWTAMIKMFTLGGFGLWYLWDAVQLSTEKERVMNYGLSAPFDAITGIAQGMLEDTGKSTYEQTTNYGVWFFLTLFGFTGFDSILMGRTWLGIHKFIICVIVLAIVIPSVTAGGYSFFGLLALLFFIPEIIGLVAAWGSDASRLLFKPNAIMKEGLPVPDTAYNGFAWFKSLYVDKNGDADSEASEETWERLKEHYIFKKEGITAAELRSRFWIGRAGEIASPTETKGEPIIPDSVPPLTIMMRLFYILGTWIVLGFNVAMAIIFPANIAVKAVANVGAAKAEAELRNFKKGVGSRNLMEGLSGLPTSLPGLPTGLPSIPTTFPGLPTPSVDAKDLFKKTKIDFSEPPKPILPRQNQGGGARKEELSTEAQIMAATVVALIAGGSLKGLVDYLMVE
jgi:hypothetical protein